MRLPTAEPHPLGPGLYRTDAFHRQPLFAVRPPRHDPDKPPLLVRSWEEAYALHGPATPEDIHPAYIACLISGNQSASVSPYRRIERLPRAHQVWVNSDGSYETSPYDPLAGGAGPMEAEALHRYIRTGLLQHLQQALADETSSIGCEHSSGLDSNSVLGGLIHGLGIDPARIHTISYDGGGEGPLLAEFRRFHGLHEAQCHRWEVPPPDREDSGARRRALLGAPPQIGGMLPPLEVLQAQGCGVVFSGFGGDQALSHNAGNVPGDLLRQGRLGDFIRWYGHPRALLRHGLIRLALLPRPLALSRIRWQKRNFGRSDILIRHLTARGREEFGPYLTNPHPWEFDPYIPQVQSLRQRVLADWVTVRAEEETRLARALGIRKVFPLLDETLIATLLNQDPLRFSEGLKQGRLIARRAFGPFLPPLLQVNPAKERNRQSGAAELSRALKHRLEQQLAEWPDWEPEITRRWKVDKIQRSIANVLGRNTPLNQVFGLNQALYNLTRLQTWVSRTH